MRTKPGFAQARQAPSAADRSRLEAASTARRNGRCAVAGLVGAVLIALPLTTLPGPGGIALAQKVVTLENSKRTAMINVNIGKSEDVRTDASFTDITVGDPEVADVNPLTDHSLSILGKKNGTTRVSVYAEGKRLIGVFDVAVTHDTSLVQSEINNRFPEARIKVTSVNGRIMLSGTVPDAVTIDKAVVIARQFGSDVINTVRVLQPQQVMLEVRFVEITRQASRELGVQWNKFGDNLLANVGSGLPAKQLPVTPTGTSSFKQPGVTSGGPNVLESALTISPVVAAGVLSGSNPFGFLVGRLLASGTEIDVLINALEQRGVARSLAEPNLVALSGDTANFLAGGEFPVPVPGALGQIAIEWKKYGVGLAFTPTVLSGGLINMRIEPEVSQLDFSHPVVLSNVSIPPLIVRRAATTVELRDGQSFVIGGLLLSKGQNAIQQLPWLGDIPVLGALFRSTQYQKDETDLAIIVTPHLVRPARPGDIVKGPLDSSLPPNDIDLFLMGKTEITPAMAKAGGKPRMIGHIIDLPKTEVGHVAVKY